MASLAGCALELPAEAPEAGIQLCFVEGDCAQGEVCEEGFCVVETSIRERVAIQLTPSNTSDVLTEQFPVVELTQGRPLPDLQFQRPKLVRGVVLALGADADSPPQPINAELIFRRTEPVIAGLTPHYQISARREGGYHALLPNGLYEITILPESADIPPEQVRQLPITADTQYDATLSGRQNTIEVTGRLVLTDVRNNKVSPVGGARVSAIDAGDARASTLATTAEDGTFTLLVRQNVEAVRLSFTPPSGSFLMPRVVTESIVLTGASVTLGDLSLGIFHLTGRPIQGILLDERDRQPVEDVTLIFRGPVGNGTIVRTSQSGEMGAFAIDLPPGVYTVQMIPRDDTDYAITEVTGLRVPSSGPPGGAFEGLTVKSKALVRGVAWSPDGARPMPGAAVLMRSTRLSDADDFEGSRVFSTRADAKGRFELKVDPGTYDITLSPTDLNGHARAFTRDIEIGDGVSAIDLFADRANLARGRVISPDGAPMADILIEIYRQDPQRGSVLIGSGLTNAVGEYRLLVPALRLQ